jgi:hypothetical protein
MALMGRRFGEAHKKPHRCGQEALQLFEEKEYEGHYKCMQNLHGFISLVKPFPTIGDTPRGSSRLRRYAVLKMIM